MHPWKNELGVVLIKRAVPLIPSFCGWSWFCIQLYPLGGTKGDFDLALVSCSIITSGEYGRSSAKMSSLLESADWTFHVHTDSVRLFRSML